MDEQPNHRRALIRRLLVWGSATIAVLLLIGAGTAFALYHKYNSQITRVSGVITSYSPTPTAVPQAAGSATALPAPPPEAANYLLVGSDSRDGDNKALPHTGADEGGERADTIILAHVPKGHRKAILVSIPRDSWVTIPEHQNAKGDTIGAHEGKINSALAFGGPALLVRTIENLSGMHIDHYVQLDFAGFVEMVNAVGGIEVCLTHDTKDSHTGIDLSAGEHHLEGVDALGYVRQRHGISDGDLGRIKRQQAVVKQIAGKVVNKGLLLHAGRLTSLLNSVTKNITVDDQLSFSDMLKLARTFSHFDSSHMETTTVPVEEGNGWRDGQSVVLLAMDDLPALFEAVSAGDLSKTESPTPSPSAATASDGASASGYGTTYVPSGVATSSATTSRSKSPSPTPSTSGGVACLP